MSTACSDRQQGVRTYIRRDNLDFQLQQPLFVATLAAVILIFGLSLFGLFEFGAFFASWAGSQHPGSNKKEGLSGSFFSGVLATAVATPCTGPFLGSAVGFAVTLPAFWALLIFTSLGIGMASPYLLFAGFPSLLRFYRGVDTLFSHCLFVSSCVFVRSLLTLS